MTPLWSAPFVRYDNFFSNRPDRTPVDLFELLTTHPEPICDAASCTGKECQFKKSRGSWSPVTLKDNSTRANANVVSINYFVADLDYVTNDVLASILKSIDGYAAILYSTHNHAPPDNGSYRLVMPLSRSVEPADWPDVRRGVIEAFGLPADPATKDLSRLYALPDARNGIAPDARAREGSPLEVDEALQIARGATARPPSLPVPPEPPTTYDLAELRARLSEVRRSKASGDERAKEHADILGSILDGQPIAEPGARDATLLKAAGLLAYWLPAGIPFEVVLEILRPGLEAMDTQPEGLGHWIEEVRDMFARQAAGRAVADAKRAEEDEKFASALRAVAGKPIRAAAELDTEAYPEGWETLLIQGKGGPKACEHNLDLILACAPEVRDTIRWNEVTKRIEIRGGPFAGSPASSLDGKVAGWLQSEKQIMAGETLVGRSLLRVARENAYDPIAEYLGEIAWDGVGRLDTFLEAYLGVETSPYARAVSRRWLISLVARALRPGCKVDTVLILEGPQGAFKSSALEALVGSAWFLDTALELGEKDTMQAIASAWIVELGELASLRKTEVDKVKQFITSKVDKFRPPYGRVTEESPRRCVLVGTCNPEEGGYLTDRTGNRRYWPVTVGTIDLKGIERDRDNILAEAVAAFRAGERWHLTPEEHVLATEHADERLVESTVEEAISRWWYGEVPARRPATFVLLDAIETALHIPVDRVSHRLRSEVGFALRRLGFIRKGREREYHAPRALLEAAQKIPASRVQFVGPNKPKEGAQA